MSSESSLPLPLEPLPPPEADERRLWIGNLDMRLTEYHLIKVLQKYGKVTKFDFLFHKCGPLKGQPRGYSFVTYDTKKEAEKALNSLNGKLLLKKTLLVKWAHTVPTEEAPPKKLVQQGLPLDIQSTKNKNVYSQINAIEAKLKAMEEQRDNELEVCLSNVPVTENKNNPLLTQKHNPTHRHDKGSPYNKMHRRNYIARTKRR